MHYQSCTKSQGSIEKQVTRFGVKVNMLNCLDIYTLQDIHYESCAKLNDLLKNRLRAWVQNSHRHTCI